MSVLALPLNPRAFRCPQCRAEPGEPCNSPQRRKVERSHCSRQDRAIRAFNAARRNGDTAA